MSKSIKLSPGTRYKDVTREYAKASAAFGRPATSPEPEQIEAAMMAALKGIAEGALIGFVLGAAALALVYYVLR